MGDEMNIVVCIKQVPEIERVKVDTASGKVVVPEGSAMVTASGWAIGTFAVLFG